MEPPRQPFKVTIRNNSHDHINLLGRNGLFPLVSVKEGLVSAGLWWESLVSAGFGLFQVVSAGFGSFPFLVITMIDNDTELIALNSNDDDIF